MAAWPALVDPASGGRGAGQPDAVHGAVLPRRSAAGLRRHRRSALRPRGPGRLAASLRFRALMCRHAAGADEEAEALLLSAKRIDPSSPDPHQALASLRLSQERAADAGAAMQAVLRIFSESNVECMPSIDFRLQSARLLIELGLIPDALKVRPVPPAPVASVSTRPNPPRARQSCAPSAGVADDRARARRPRRVMVPALLRPPPRGGRRRRARGRAARQGPPGQGTRTPPRPLPRAARGPAAPNEPASGAVTAARASHTSSVHAAASPPAADSLHGLRPGAPAAARKPRGGYTAWLGQVR